MLRRRYWAGTSLKSPGRSVCGWPPARSSHWQAARAGILLSVPIPYPAWAGWSMLLAAASAILSIAIGWANRAALAGWLSLLLGLGQSITAFVANARGISTHPGQVRLSGAFGQELGMFEGMLFAAVPVAALAFRIGRSGASMRCILWSGVAGVWAPAVLSIALISLATVGGAQLHHRSSMPVTITFALNIVHTGPGMRIGLLWAGLTTIGPSVVLGLWLRDLAPAGRWPKLAILGIAGGLAAAWELFPLTANWFRDSYPVWCWTVMAAILLTGLFLAVARLKFVSRSAD